MQITPARRGRTASVPVPGPRGGDGQGLSDSHSIHRRHRPRQKNLYKIRAVSCKQPPMRNANIRLIDTQTRAAHTRALATVRRFDGSTVRRFDGSTVRRFDGSTVRRFDGSTVRRFDGSTVRRFDGSTVRRFDGSTVRRFDGSTVRRFDGSTVRRFDGSTVRRFDGSTVRRFDGSTVRRFDGSTVRRFDGSTVRRFDGSTVRRFDGSTVRARECQQQTRPRECEQQTPCLTTYCSDKRRSTNNFRGRVFQPETPSPTSIAPTPSACEPCADKNPPLSGTPDIARRTASTTR